jgi:hypothetical protein
MNFNLDIRSMNFNLDIRSYNFKEILQLFELSDDKEISIEDMKKAKIKVLSMHPDKIKLSSHYFIFFKKAYEIIVQYYQDQPEVKIKHIMNDDKVVYDIKDDIKHNKVVKKQLEKMDKEEFTNFFNTMYEENMIDKEQRKKQIDKSEWFKQTDPHSSNINIESVRQTKINEQICKFKEVKTRNGNFGSKIYDDDDDDDAYIYCDPSSKLLFDDLRKVHLNETIINAEVMNISDYNPLYNDCDELRTKRTLDNNKKQTNEELIHYNRILNINSRKDIKLILKRHNDVIKNEEYKSINKQIISRFLKITN